MAWCCDNCGRKNGDSDVWCGWCDEAERQCDCGGLFEWEMNDAGQEVSCKDCGKIVWSTY